MLIFKKQSKTKQIIMWRWGAEGFVWCMSWMLSSFTLVVAKAMTNLVTFHFNGFAVSMIKPTSSRVNITRNRGLYPPALMYDESNLRLWVLEAKGYEEYVSH